MHKKILIIPLGILVLAVTAGGFYLVSDGAFAVWQALLLSILLFCPALLFPLSSIVPSRKARKHLHRLAEAIIGSYLYLLILLLVDAAVCYLSYMTGAFSVNLPLMAVATILALFAIRLYGSFHARKIYRKQYEMTLKSQTEGHFRAVLFSDLHLGYFTTKDFLKRLSDCICKEDADAVFIAGDLFDTYYDEIKEEDAAIKALSAISEKMPIYLCRGNHDSYAMDDPRTAVFYQKAGITLLADEALSFPLFTLYGRRDRHEQALSRNSERKTVAEVLATAQGKPMIVLDHNPAEAGTLLDAGAKLVLCGHTHNGQTFPGNIATRMFSGYSYGLKQKNSGYAVTTAGAGYWGPPLRVGTSNEIVLLDIFFSTK